MSTRDSVFKNKGEMKTFPGAGTAAYLTLSLCLRHQHPIQVCVFQLPHFQLPADEPKTEILHLSLPSLDGHSGWAGSGLSHGWQKPRHLGIFLCPSQDIMYGAGLEVRQLGLEPLCDAGVPGSGFACYTTMLVHASIPRFFSKVYLFILYLKGRATKRRVGEKDLSSASSFPKCL